MRRGWLESGLSKQYPRQSSSTPLPGDRCTNLRLRRAPAVGQPACPSDARPGFFQLSVRPRDVFVVDLVLLRSVVGHLWFVFFQFIISLGGTIGNLSGIYANFPKLLKVISRLVIGVVRVFCVQCIWGSPKI